jgi:hypothetical protein
MVIIPVQAVPNQALQASLGGQATQINLRVMGSALYADVLVNNTPIIQGVLCRHRTKIVRDAYLGFIGELAFFDQQGADDPVYTGIGSRWLLYYFEPGEFA